MKILKNNVAVVEGDFLSQIVEDRGSLGLIGDGVVATNLQYIRPGDWVVDGGAAIGDHTTVYLDRVGPTGKVLAFEPHPRFLECLRHNCPGAEIHPEALSDATGTAMLHVDTMPNLGGSWIGPDGTYQIRTIRLDDLNLRRLDLLKLDIEGHELRALIGATETICRFNPVIEIEWIPSAVARAGVDPNMVLEWFRICNYDYKFFMGDERAGEIIAVPTRAC